MKLTYNDQQHAYRLDGKRCKSVTAVAKIPDDTYNLNQWQKRQVAIGLAAAPELLEKIAAHFDDKETINAVCEEALVAAKAHAAADRGTAWHRITERVDLAEEMIETAQSKAIRAAWTRALENAGLEVVSEFVERIVVYPDLLLCGKFDRIMRRKADGRYVVVDLKTGENAVRYPHSIAIQEGIYANAPLMAGPIGGQSGSTEQFDPLPEPLDRTLGYVVHMPDTDHVEVVGVDIEAGWNIARSVCFPVIDWRKRGDLIFPLPAVAVHPTEGESNGDHVSDAGLLGAVRADGLPGGEDHETRTADAPGAADEGEPSPEAAATAEPGPDGEREAGTDGGNGPSDGGHDGSGSEPAPTAAGDNEDRDARKRARAQSRLAVDRPGADENHAVAIEHRYEWLRARLKTIIDAGHGVTVAARWPADTPTLKTLEHDDAGLDRIAELLGHVEAEHAIPFGPGLRTFIPGAAEDDAAAAIVEAFPGSAVIAGDDQKKPYANWIRQIVARDPGAGDRITADLQAVGLQKSLTRDEWTNDELKTLDTVLRRAERAALTAPGASHEQQQLAS